MCAPTMPRSSLTSSWQQVCPSATCCCTHMLQRVLCECVLNCPYPLLLLSLTPLLVVTRVRVSWPALPNLVARSTPCKNSGLWCCVRNENKPPAHNAFLPYISGNATRLGSSSLPNPLQPKLATKHHDRGTTLNIMTPCSWT